MGTIISLLSGKGGMGTSSVTTLLGHSFGELFPTQKILCLDMNWGMRGLEFYFSYHSPIFHTMKDVIEEGVSLEEALLPSPNQPNCFLLPAPQSHIFSPAEWDSFANFLKKSKESFDWIFIDGPSGRGEEVQHYISLSDEVLLIGNQEFLSIRGMDQIYTICKKLQKKEVSVLFNRCTPRKGETEGWAEIQMIFPAKPLGVLPDYGKLDMGFDTDTSLISQIGSLKETFYPIVERLSIPFSEREDAPIFTSNEKENHRETSIIQKIYKALSFKRL